MPYDRSPSQRIGRTPSALPNDAPGWTATATSKAVAIDSRRIPPWYSDIEYWLVKTNIPTMTTRAAMPTPLTISRPLGGIFLASWAGRQSMAMAAPISRPPALVSVPSYARVLSKPGVAMLPHQREGDGRQPEGYERDPAELALEQFEEKQQEKGPEQIELLLHRQGPEVIERSRTGESVEVGHAGRDRGPVRDVEQGSQGLARPGGQGTAVDDEGRDEDDEQHQDDGRQQAPGPSQPEVLEVKVSGAVPGRQQDGRDQVAAQGEEDPDPEQAARHPRSTEVVHDDRDHRNGADTVESRQIRCFMANRAWHPCPCRRTGRSDGEVRTTLNAPLPVEQVRLPVEQVRRDHARGGAVQFGGFRRAERVASQARIIPDRRRPDESHDHPPCQPTVENVADLPDYAEAVLAAVDQVPAGRVVTYGDIAEYVGAGGPRQVGHVLALHGGSVTWWRVIRADGRPAAGLEAEALARLRVEGAPMRGERVDLARPGGASQRRTDGRWNTAEQLRGSQ